MYGVSPSDLQANKQAQLKYTLMSQKNVVVVNARDFLNLSWCQSYLRSPEILNCEVRQKSKFCAFITAGHLVTWGDRHILFIKIRIYYTYKSSKKYYLGPCENRIKIRSYLKYQHFAEQQRDWILHYCMFVTHKLKN